MHVYLIKRSIFSFIYILALKTWLIMLFELDISNNIWEERTPRYLPGDLHMAGCHLNVMDVKIC